MANETNATQTIILGRFELFGAGYAEGENLIANLRKVTPEDIQRVCAEMISNIQFVLIGNPEKLDIEAFLAELN